MTGTLPIIASRGHAPGSRPGASRLLTVRDVAARLAVSERKVWTMIALGKLTPLRFGRRTTRVEESDVLRLLDVARRAGAA